MIVLIHMSNYNIVNGGNSGSASLRRPVAYPSLFEPAAAVSTDSISIFANLNHTKTSRCGYEFHFFCNKYCNIVIVFLLWIFVDTGA